MTQEKDSGSRETWAAYREDDDDGTIYWAVHSESDCRFIANVYSKKEDARLISAAPELLEALQDFDNWFASFDPASQASRMEGRRAVIKARAAISKARGQ